MITKEYLDEVFFYDSKDGELYYRDTGKLAGQKAHGKYVRVNIGNGNGRRYAHHIIWCMVHGGWPKYNIDHRRDGSNKLDNIREATQSQNMANRTYGELRGIEKHGAKLRVRIWVDGRRIELGSYDTMEQAKAAYREGAEKYFGEFAFHNREN